MLPKAFARLIMGRGANELRRRRPPIRYDVDPDLIARAKADPRVRHDVTAGGFVAVDEEAEAAPPVVTVLPLEGGVGQSLAEEARRLAGTSGVEE